VSLGYSGSFTADGPSEFWYEICGARCTRSSIDGTEYGHLVGCPNRPDFDHSHSGSGHRYTSNQDDPSDGGASA